MTDERLDASLKRWLAVIGLISAVALSFAGACSSRRREVRPFTVGVTSGPHAQILEVVSKVAASRGLQVKVVEFTDYVQPNAALDDGSLDLNSFQHQPYLDQQSRVRGYRFESVGKTVTFPIAAYSQSLKSLKDLPPGAVVALPNDPTNGARALRLLEREGALTLSPKAGLEASVLDVVWTKGGLDLKELDAAQLPRALADVHVAIINTNYALEAGLDPVNGSLAREPADSPYANVLVVRASDTARPEVKTFVEAYHSPEVKAFVEKTFHGAVVTAW